MNVMIINTDDSNENTEIVSDDTDNVLVEHDEQQPSSQFCLG